MGLSITFSVVLYFLLLNNRNIMAGDTSELIARVNQKFGLNEKTYNFNCSVKSSDITGIKELIISVSISKQTNDLPYGVFQIKQSSYGDLCFKRMPQEEKKPILNNPLDLSVYLEELKAGSLGRKNKKHPCFISLRAMFP